MPTTAALVESATISGDMGSGWLRERPKLHDPQNAVQTSRRHPRPDGEARRANASNGVTFAYKTCYSPARYFAGKPDPAIDSIMKSFLAVPNAILALSLAACASNPNTTGDPVQDHMYAHFSEAGKVQTAVVFGDLDGMRSAARNLAEHEEPQGLPEAGLPFLAAMRETAGQIAAESSLPDAAMETARLGATCGSCHEATDGGPVFRPNGMSREDVSQTMVRHIQGADRLWEGLIGPSDRAWEAGADLLASGSVDPGTMAARPGQESMFAEIFRLGRLAQDADDQGERTQVYGQILSTCSGCHTAPDDL